MLEIYNKLRDKINKLPNKTGVYYFLDKNKEILYIGKATNLKDRVKSYFGDNIGSARGLKIIKMITLVSDIKYKETDSVLEALLLENQLIKKYNPLYNSKEKDDKSYSCVVIKKESYPRVLIQRMRDYEATHNRGDIMYGPFTSISQLRDIMRIIRKIFPYRDNCQIGERDNINNKPCFNYQLGLCPGVCIGKISESEYKNKIKYIKKLFQGNINNLVKELKKDMNKYAKDKKFEQAAEIRNSIFAITHIRDISLIKREDVLNTDFNNNNLYNRIEGYDVAHISGSNRVGVMVVMEDNRIKKSEYRKFKLIENVNDDYMGLAEILRRRFSHREWKYPDLIVLDGGKGQLNIAKGILKNLKLDIPICAVVKDNRHKAKDIIFDIKIVDKDNVKNNILLINSEAHRFAIQYHIKRREKII